MGKDMPKERRLIVLNYKKGCTIREIGEMLDMPFTKAYYWIKRYKEQGINGLKTIKQHGKKPLLGREALKWLKEFLKKNKPSRYNGKAAGWSSREVKDCINNKFNISYSLRHVERLLHKLGFSLIAPRPRNVKASLLKQAAFKRRFKKNLTRNIWDCQ